MTAITLAYKKIFLRRADPVFAYADIGGWVMAHDRMLSFLFLAGIVISLACYIGGMYVSFGMGTVIGAQEKKIQMLSDEIREREYALQEKISFIPEEHKEFLSSMERVSSIDYIGADGGYVASRNIPTP